MTKASKVRALILAFTAVLMFVSMGASPLRAQDGNLGTRPGGTRGDGTPVQVVVKLDGNPVAGVSVTFTAKKSVTVKTDDNGVASISLIPGHYTVTASNDSGSAKKMVNVPKSTTTTIVALTLTPPSGAAPKMP